MKTGSVAFMLALLCGVTALLPHAVTVWLMYDRDAILSGQIWRAWTGHWVHFSWQHAVADTLVLFVSTWMLSHRAGVKVAAWVLLAGAPLIALGLLLAVPDLRIYAGASGIATMTAAAVAGRLWQDAPRLRSLLGLLAFAVVIRMALDAGDGLPRLGTLPAGIRVVWQAHALGLLLGVWFAQWRSPRSAGTSELGWRTALRSVKSPT